MTAKYTSLLVCFHPNHSDLYINGVLLAIVKGGAVELNKVNPLILPDSAFNDIATLQDMLNNVLDETKKEINKNGQK
jgi:hypothetical protein